MATLNTAQLRQFAQEGYLVVDDVVDPDRDFKPAMDAYAEVLDDLARQLFAEGKITSLYEGLEFLPRLTEISAETQEDLSQHFDISLPQTGVHADTPIFTGPAMFRVLSNPDLLDLVESVIGSEIFSSPVQHIRLKLPKRAIGTGVTNQLVAKAPWHQDIGVLLPEADQTTVLTAWIPMNEATIPNGCLQVIPRSHQPGKLFDHCPGGPGGLAIPDHLLPPGEPLPLPMKPGSVLLMTQSTVHSSLDNVTPDQVRLSLDLRYQPTGQPTGRPAFAPAGFVARSRKHPETQQLDPAAWARNWITVRDDLAALENPTFNRWNSDSPACA